jgi:putative glutathione S-transferase
MLYYSFTDSTPLQTALEAKQFLIACHDQSKHRDSSVGMPNINPSTVSAVDYNSFLMQQSKRQRELKMRRREAEQLLHGFRGFYGESFSSWSPRHAKKERNSFGLFGFPAEDTLRDPDDDSRRLTTPSQLEGGWGEAEDRDDSQRFGKGFVPNPLGPNRGDFLIDDRHYDGTQYPRTEQDMEVGSGVVMFSPRGDGQCDNQFREGPHSARSSTSRFILTPGANGEGDNQFRERHPSTTRSTRSTRSSSSQVMFSPQANGENDNQFRNRLNMALSPTKANGERPPSTTKSSTSKRKDFFQDSTDASFVDFEGDDNGFAVKFDDNTWKGDDQTSDNLEERREPYKERRMKLEINTEREDVIDVTASEQRLRQAEGDLDERESSADSTTPTPPIQRVDKRDPEGSLTESASREEALLREQVLHKQKAAPAPVPETIWRSFISDEPGAKFQPEAGRYHLYASYACPGSHRSLIVRALKGLEDVISVTIVHPTWRHTNPENPRDKHRGWIFGDPDGQPFHNTMGRGGPFPPAYEDNSPDPVLNAYSVRNLYEYAKDTSGNYTIPLLWDTKLNTIVNNESSDISYMLNSCFNKFAQNPELDLYTEDDEDGLDRLNEVSQWLYPMMIHGVYRCGFAKTQRAYDQSIEELTQAFDAADELLQHQRYLTGDTLTDADIRFFVTLLRFDEVYAFYFRANTRLVLMTPSLLNYCREIYQMPGVASTCQMDQIKAHFFGSHAEWNKYSVVPRGLGFMRYLEMPHDRAQVGGLSHC